MLVVIGVSGVTCSGKTTLATQIKNVLPNTNIISQDTYFREVDDPKHTWISELNHINFDILSSLDMERMLSDVQKYIDSNQCLNNHNGKSFSTFNEHLTFELLHEKALKKIQSSNINILIIEGFCIFNYMPIGDLCNLKYFLTLPKDECFNRRNKRTYDPPDCPGYFELCVWPEYTKLYNEVLQTVNDVQYVDTSAYESLESILIKILLDLINY